MPPKKKANKKAQEDWEADLGESVAPPANELATENANGDKENGEDDAAAGGGGGLMAQLRKRKEKRKNKGLPEDDISPGDDTAGTEPADGAISKAAEEANLDVEFALPQKTGKGPKGKHATKEPEPEEDGGETGRMLTKAEKEKLKKEREKQRKKEQVRIDICCCGGSERTPANATVTYRLQRRRRHPPSRLKAPRRRKRRKKRTPRSPRPLLPSLAEARRKRFQPTLL